MINTNRAELSADKHKQLRHAYVPHARRGSGPLSQGGSRVPSVPSVAVFDYIDSARRWVTDRVTASLTPTTPSWTLRDVVDADNGTAPLPEAGWHDTAYRPWRPKDSADIDALKALVAGDTQP